MIDVFAAAGGVFILFILFILLGIPLGYTKVEKKEVKDKTTISVRIGEKDGK